MKLIITEKPKVAEQIAEAIGATKQSGCYTSPNYTIVWAFGHLVKIDDKDLPSSDWANAQLPIFPEKFDYKPASPDHAKQLKIIKDQVKKATEIIIATDAEREGELIARLILEYSDWNDWSNTYRFWTSEALTPKVVTDTLNKLHPSTKFDSVYYAALSRQHADWLIGMNFTMAVTNQASGGLWSVGRVQTPTLGLIVNRDLLRANFKPVQYFIIKATFINEDSTYEGTYFNDTDKTINPDDDSDQEEGDNSSAKLNRAGADEIFKSLAETKIGTIISVEKQKKSEQAPLLHSLSSLQREANTSFGFSAQETLDIAQELYETHNCLSYPRTSSQYLADSSKDLVKEILTKLNKSSLIPAVETVGKRVFNNAKLSDHHALIPLALPPANLNEKALKLYNLVARKFIGLFMPEYKYEVTQVITILKDFKFKSSGKITVQAGWKNLYAGEDKNILPDLSEGKQVVKKQLDVIEKYTKPQPAFTEATLIAIMVKLKLATDATRAGIIETLIESRKYLKREKKNIIATEKGIELITKSTELDYIQPELTAKWESELELMIDEDRGYKGYTSFISGIKEYVTSELDNIKALTITSNSAAPAKMMKLAKELAAKHKLKLEDDSFEYIKEFIGKYITEVVDYGSCSCGKPIKETKMTFTCECGKLVWKEIFKKKITVKQAQDLLNNKVVEIKGCTGSKGKFDAKLRLIADNKLEFVK